MRRKNKAELRAAARKVIADGNFTFNSAEVSPQDYWFYATLAEENPAFLVPYLPQLWQHLDKTNASALRCGLAVMRKVNLPESLEGEVYAFCMQRLNEGKQPVAILSFCLWICTKISLKHPDLGRETLDQIKYYQDRRTEPALQSAAKNAFALITRR